MAKTLSKLIIILFTIFFCSTLANSESESFGKTISPQELGLKKLKGIYMKFYLQDQPSGKNATLVQVAEAPTTNQSATMFSRVEVADFPLTETPDLKSKQVGRAQAINTFVSQSELTLLMTMNFVFTQGKYNGSTLATLGNNPVDLKLREMPILGGTGLFRFATGYIQLSTYSYDSKIDHRVLEYNLYVFHYS